MKIKYIALILGLGLLALNCNKEEECFGDTFPISEFFAELNNEPDWKEKVSYDFQIHEYSFKLEKEGQICSIGYQSQNESDAYVIEIENNLGELIFQETMSFETTQTEYVQIPSLFITTNQEYTIRRTATSSSRSIGRILESQIVTPNVFNDSLYLPLKIGDMTITDVSFYGQGVQEGEGGIPFIDFGFKSY